MKDYHINIFYSEEDKGYSADIPDLKYCSAFGETPIGALQELALAKQAWIESAKAEDKPIPLPTYRPILPTSIRLETDRNTTAQSEELMAQRVKVWFDPEADFLEVLFSEAPGYMRETKNDAVTERVDASGNILGFSIMAVSQLDKSKPLVAELLSGSEAA